MRYPGGKTAYAPLLRRVIADNRLRGCNYVEPFAGGGGLALNLLFAGDVGTVWLNDLDYAVFAFWKAILDCTDDFIAMVRSTDVSVAEWRCQRAVHRGGGTDILARGFAAFYLNRCNRAGILAANPVGGLQQTGAYRLDARFKKEALVGKIRAVADRREAITVSNLDAADLLRRLPPTANTLIYLDPPYCRKGALLYSNHYASTDHFRLRDAIAVCEHPWLLSYDDAPEIVRLYRGMNIYRCGRRYSISAPSIGSELIITDLRVPEELTRYLEATGERHGRSGRRLRVV